MYVCATEFFSRDFLSRSRLHQRRTAQKNCSLIADDDGFITHCGHVCSTRGARAKNRSNLIYAERRHACLVIKDSAEVFAVREDLGLQWKKRSARVDQVKTGKIVLKRDLLSTKMFLNRDREVRAALNGG